MVRSDTAVTPYETYRTVHLKQTSTFTFSETVQDIFGACSGIRIISEALARCIEDFRAEQDNFEAVTALLTTLNSAIDNNGAKSTCFFF